MAHVRSIAVPQDFAEWLLQATLQTSNVTDRN